MMPIVLCYDDACHLLARLLSLMGAHWQAALAVCLIISLDGFHKVNHIAKFCVGALNPKRFPQIHKRNTQACEQTNRWLNKHSSSVRQKNGGGFRFYIFRTNDLRNELLVQQKQEPEGSDLDPEAASKDLYVPLNPRRKYDKNYRAKKAAYNQAVETCSIFPNLPAEYLGVSVGESRGAKIGGTGPTVDFVVGVDVNKFKVAWKKTLKKEATVKESKKLGVKLTATKKHSLRRALAEFVVDKKITTMKSSLALTTAAMAAPAALSSAADA